MKKRPFVVEGKLFMTMVLEDEKSPLDCFSFSLRRIIHVFKSLG